MEQRREAFNQLLHEEAGAADPLVVLDGDVERLVGADDYAELLRPSEGGVEEVALEQDIVLGQKRHDHGLVLTALGFVGGDGEGGGDVVQLLLLEPDLPAGEIDQQPEVRLVDVDDEPDIAVEDLLLVVVPDLHDLVPDPELPCPDLESVRAGVETCLELGVEVVDTAPALVHRAYDLDLQREGRDPELLRDVETAEAHDGLEGLFLVLVVDEIEIRVPVLARRIDQAQALIHPVSVLNDEASLLLAEYLIEGHYLDPSGGDDVMEEIPRTDRRQLVFVPAHDEAHLPRHGFEQGVHQQQVDHRGLVDDKGIGPQRMPFVSLEAPLLGVVLQSPVDGLGLLPSLLGKALGSAARGRGQQDLPTPAVEDSHHSPDDRRLTRARTTRQSQDLPPETLLDGFSLPGRELQREPAFDLGDRLVCIGREGRTRQRTAP